MPGRQSVYACGLWPLKRGASGEVSAYEQAGRETNEADQGGVPPAWLSGTFVVGWLQAFLLLHSQLGFVCFRGQFLFPHAGSTSFLGFSCGLKNCLRVCSSGYFGFDATAALQ
jgi:hypothetical protein